MLMRSPPKRYATAISAFLVLAMSAVACGDATTSTGGGGGKETIRVGLPVHHATYAPVYIALQKGLFKEAGAEVELVVFTGGSKLVKAVASGSVDIGVTSLAGVLSGVTQGQPLKVFYGGFNAPIFEWWAKPSITSVREGKGKRWGVTSIGSSTDFLTRYVLGQHGMDPQNDVNIVTGGGSSARLIAMKDGQMDVNVFAAPESFKAEELGYNRIASQKKLMDGYPDHVSFTREDFLNEKPGTVKAFLRGLVKGFKMTKDRPQAAQQAILEYEKIDPAYIERTYKTFVDYQYPDGRLPNSESMDTFWRIGVNNGLFEERIPKSEWLVTKWIDGYPQWTK